MCPRCGLEKEMHPINTHLCVDCVKAENNRVSHYRNHNYNWMEVATESELELWERQPGETDHEYHIWLRYRDAYPGKRPSYRDVAEQIGSTVNAVRKVGSRWSFPTRLQAWAKYCDELTLTQRRQEILAMNEDHVAIASTLRDKLKKAIDLIDPYALSPREINQLFKTATEIEKKARLDTVPTGGSLLVDDDNPELKQTEVKTDSMKEIIEILGKAGQLQNIGVRQTVTTEVVVKE